MLLKRMMRLSHGSVITDTRIPVSTAASILGWRCAAILLTLALLLQVNSCRADSKAFGFGQTGNSTKSHASPQHAVEQLTLADERFETETHTWDGLFKSRAAPVGWIETRVSNAEASSVRRFRTSQCNLDKCTAGSLLRVGQWSRADEIVL